jgi:superfamily II DNA or RNA helicase
VPLYGHPMAAEAVQDLCHVDLTDVEEVVGVRSFERGRKYAGTRVLRLDWDPGEETLAGRVVGQRAVYDTFAYFDSGRTGEIEFLEGDCSCPVGVNCKHVAAIVLAAAGSGPRASSKTPAKQPRSRPRPASPVWDEALGALLPSTPDSAPDLTPLAVEVALVAPPAPAGSANPRLLARLVRQGRNNWVRGGISWDELEYWHLSRHNIDPAHAQVARKLCALYRATDPRFSHYAPSADKTIDLTVFDRSLWALLEEAQRVGLQLVHATPGLGALGAVCEGELRLDVTRATAGGLQVLPSLWIDSPNTDVVPVGFLGAPGHGAIFVHRAELDWNEDAAGCRFGLARLTSAAPEALRALVRTGQPINVPAKDEARFGEQMWPRLRHVAPVLSSDGSFTPPTISGPTLHLQTHYGGSHAVVLSWSWAYGIGDREQRAAVDADPLAAGYRDPAAEQDVLDSLSTELLENLGVLDGSVLRPEVGLTGLDTMRFTTEALPLLADDPRVSVEFIGEPADFREMSDSLTIGVSTHEVRGEPDWFDLGITIAVDGTEVPFIEVFLALAAGDEHLLLPDGAYFSLLKPELQALRRLIDEARSLDDRPPDSLRISRYQVSWWDELCELGVVRGQADAWERQVTALRNVESIGAASVPASLTADLRPYQRDGFGWLAFLWEHRLGGILADDMGLGKTLQVLALIAHARGIDPTSSPFLVVAPTSVVPNWAAEAHRFAPHLSVVTVTDTLKRSGRTIDDVVHGADVVVTSYTLARLDFDAYGGVEWAGALLDEAQHTKNHRSKIYGCLRQLRAPFKLAITGTPMENNLMELWALLSLTAPGLFPNPTRFAENYARPIERHGDTELLAQLRRRIKPLVKRRTKDLVAAELPEKQEQVVSVELHPKHRKIYRTRLQRERQRVLGLIAEDFERNRFTILQSITLLRQLSLHPVLVDQAYANVPSAKIDLLVEQLHEVIDGGHRALVFSQFTTFLREVRSRLDKEAVPACYLDGRTRNRDKAIRRFKDGDAPVFLISLKAGGVGLNLTEADYCFLLDPWWNPATEAQAIDRSHRIGQTRTVMAYRMIATGTIEEKVQELKERKANLFKGVMDDGDLFSGKLEAEDIRGLFG